MESTDRFLVTEVCKESSGGRLRAVGRRTTRDTPRTSILFFKGNAGRVGCTDRFLLSINPTGFGGITRDARRRGRLARVPGRTASGEVDPPGRSKLCRSRERIHRDITVRGLPGVPDNRIVRGVEDGGITEARH